MNSRFLCYEEKDAWYNFVKSNPAEAEAISSLLANVWIQKSGQTDVILRVGYPVQVLSLRIACLLGLTTHDWTDLLDMQRET